MAKTCGVCGEAKDVGDFHRNAAKPDGLCYDCKDCRREKVKRYQDANPDAVRESRAKFIRSQKGKAASRRRHLKKTYGITEDERDAIFAAQGHRCAICQGTEGGRFWAVDHDHATGAVRGILCWHCNVALGHFRDSTTALRSAIDYLELSALEVRNGLDREASTADR